MKPKTHPAVRKDVLKALGGNDDKAPVEFGLIHHQSCMRNPEGLSGLYTFVDDIVELMDAVDTSHTKRDALLKYLINIESLEDYWKENVDDEGTNSE